MKYKLQSVTSQQVGHRFLYVLCWYPFARVTRLLSIYIVGIADAHLVLIFEKKKSNKLSSAVLSWPVYIGKLEADTHV